MKPCTVAQHAYDSTCGKLAETGLSVGVIVAGALVILALGVALWWVDKAR